VNKLEIQIDGCGYGGIYLDGQALSHCVGVSVEIKPGELPVATIKLAKPFIRITAEQAEVKFTHDE
jgi:hypothetical protein